MKSVTDKIISNKWTCVFLSPHLDDAVLSSGALISYLTDKTEVRVVTAFTECSKSSFTMSARAYLKQCAYNSFQDLYKQRREEDMEALKSIGVKFQHLEFIEAIYRKKHTLPSWKKIVAKWLPELNHIYPIYRWHITKGEISNDDKKNIEKLTEKIVDSIDDKTIVFAPMAVGKNVDHVIIRDIANNLEQPVIFWSDQPYNTCHQINKSFAENNQLSKYNWSTNLAAKQDIVQTYSSQAEALYPKGYQVTEEQYYIKKKDRKKLS